ncbi:hypothetical protein MPTK1_5g18570 [Marchantia polymorpha subsp. ruderalis]|uniref:Folate receptor-like domain-containing protein n=2 Tax=Marchantia polymorpha TaxID=3197 RepID=A0AAF6BJS2_MARPO|nr:hypothetical protein MARPO_0073s0083 [Marchantia polymorpha]BBN12256.1 hypothetical protein Mp_5g18570 [Marchantia polymorpha subsp. ruderalis]|eukprot:PTQ35219.1 hypothetical protein MARPO_0073s0083 [Marchantia polymorpha]
MRRRRRMESSDRRMPQGLLLLSWTVALLCGCVSQAYSGQEGVCVSQGSRFPKFSLENHAPRKASKGKIDLTLCRYYRKKTCCDVVQTHAAILTLQKLAGSGEASSQCLEQWEVLECSICDPRVGITPGPPLLCPAFCESVFSACADAFFSTDPLTQMLMPCGPKDVLCARAKEWASNSSAFCQLAGFASVDTRNQFNFLEERACYDGKAEAPGSADEVVKIKQRSTRRAKHDSSLDMLRKYIENMDVAVQIMWAIGGLVLTAGALHLRRRTLLKNSTAAVVMRNKQLQEEARARQQAVYKVSAATSAGAAKRDKKPRDSPKAA